MRSNNLVEIDITENIDPYEHYQKTKTISRHISYFLYINFLTLSEANSFCKKNMADKLMTCRLVQVI